MRILLADSDRDLLQCYQKLLTMENHSVLTAFDGAQAVSMLRTHPFDLAVLQETLPRLEYEQILPTLKQNGIPVIVLTERRATVKALLKKELPNAYLPFPFLPEAEEMSKAGEDLTELIRAVAKKAHSDERFSRCGVEVNVNRFCLSGAETGLTNGEIDLLRDLEKPVKSSGRKTRIMVQALNEKLHQTGKHARIIYEIEKGYRLVSEDE